jgi:hypothetical protein
MSNEKQQTAVDFYREHIHALSIDGKTHFTTTKEIYEEAKKIEKQKIKKTYIDCLRSTMVNPLGDEFYEPQAEEYYQNEFGGNK